MTMRGKQILALGLLKSKKKIKANYTFFRDNEGTIILKNSPIQGICMAFFPNLCFINSEKGMATPNFLFGYQEHLLKSAFSAQF